MGAVSQALGPGRVRDRHLDLGLSSPLAEPLDLSAGVHDPLRAREERVADRADLGLELFACRAGRERVSTRASHDRVFVESGMNLCFQVFTPGKVSLPSQRREQTLGLKA